MMKCQGKDCDYMGLLLPVADGEEKSQTYVAYKPQNRWGNDQFAGSPGHHKMFKYKYLCAECLKEHNEPEYPF